MKFVLILIAAAASLMILLSSRPTYAQVEWLNPEGTPGLQLEFTAGSFESYGYYYYYSKITFPTSSLFATVRGRFSRTVSGIAEFAYFWSKYKYVDDYYMYAPIERSRLGIANPYLGLEVGREGTSPLWNLGIRIPIISEENMYWALPQEYISSHRFLAYLNKVVQVSSNWGYRFVAPSGFGLRTAVGLQLAIPKRGDIEAYLDLGTNFWYRTKGLRMMTAFSSLYALTEEGIDFGNRHLTSLSFAADIPLGQLEPGLHVQFPIGENLTESINNMYGVHLIYRFPTGGPNR